MLKYRLFSSHSASVFLLPVEHYYMATLLQGMELSPQRHRGVEWCVWPTPS